MTASPLSTGGAGPDFETEVGVYYLAALLCGSAFRGAQPAALVRVGVQRAVVGALLDDVVVEAEVAGERARTDLQLKRTLSFAKSDAEFVAVIRACWRTVHMAEFAAPGNRVGVVSAHFPAKVKSHYVRVPVSARASADADDFFSRIDAPRFASKEMREFVSNVRAVLDAYVAECREKEAIDGLEPAVPDVTNDGLWNLLKRFVILEFDYTQDQSRDRTFVLESLRQVIASQDLQEARRLYGQLEEIAREMAQSGGSHDALSLRERLLAEGFAIAARPTTRRDQERLSDHADLVLSGIDSTIGGVALDRGDIVSDVLTKVEAGQSIIVTGAAGFGKSAILRGVVEARRSQGPVVAFEGHRLNSVVGWDGLAAVLRIESRLPELVLSLSGTARPCLVIDGLDKVESIGGRQAVNDVLRAVGRSTAGPNSASQWTVIATAREESLDSLREWLDILRGSAPAGVTVVRVPPLVDDDLSAIGERLPHLAPILARASSNVLLRNLYFLRTVEEFARAGQIDGSAGLSLVTEADVARIWWERLVGGNASRDRQQAMLSFGERALSNRSQRIGVGGLELGVVRGLERDGIIRRDPETDTYWFSHDILEEWTVARVIGQASDAIGHLRNNGDPFWAAGALQLYASSILEQSDGAARWRELLSHAEEGAGPPRWAEVVLAAPFRSTRLRELLPQIGDVLREENGRRLGSFLRALRTRFIRPNPILEKILQSHQMEAAERNALLLEMGIPWGPAWVPVLSWLTPQLPDLPWQAREEASRIMLVWQRTPIPDLPFRREIAEAALKWRSVLIHPSGVHVLVGREQEPFFHRLRDVVAASAEAIPDLVPAFLAGLRQTESSHDLQRWVGQSPQVSLVQHAASAFVDFVLDILVPRWRGDPNPESSASVGRRRSAFDEDEEWQHLHLHLGSAFINPSQFRGPFLILLRANEREGLRLIGTLLNRATASYLRDQESHGGGRQLPIVIRFAKSSPITAGLGVAPPGTAGSETVETASLSGQHTAGTSLPANEEAESLGSRVPTFLERRFTGDARVYQWFRPNSGAPYPVLSALMALELWMEEQMEAGRNPAELFEAVLQQSESVACVGVCVGIALAYPDQSLDAAAPFVGAPLVWEYDIARFTSDRHGTFNVNAFLGISDEGDRPARERDNRPQRRAEIRDLMWRYMFVANERLRDQVLASVRAFPDDLSPLTPEQRENGEVVGVYRERMQNYVALAEPENYRWIKTPDGADAVLFQPPEELQQRNAPVRERLNTMSEILAVRAWADETLATGRADSRMTATEAIRRAKAMQRDDDFSAALTLNGDPTRTMRLEAIVGVAAAVALLSASDATLETTTAWFTHVLVSASKIPINDDGLGHLAAAELLVRAANGLMALVESRRADEHVRIAVLRLVRHRESKVGNAVFSRLRRVWDIDPLLCKNLVARELGLATAPKRSSGWDHNEYARAEALNIEQREAFELAIENDLRAGNTPARLALKEPETAEGDQHVRDPGSLSGAYWTTHVSRVFESVPIERIADGSERDWVIRLTSFVLTWTIAQYRLHDGRPSSSSAPYPFEWPDFLGEWLALMAVYVLGERDANATILEPLHTSWPATAELTAGLLWGYTKHFLVKDEIPPVASRHWRQVAAWVVTNAAVEPWRRRDRELEEALDLLLHVRNGRALLTAEWRKAPDFVDVYELWVEHSIRDAHGMATLLKFLEVSGRHLGARTATGLLAKALEKIPTPDARDKMWRELGGGTAMSQLLATIWEKHQTVIRANQESLQEFVHLLDELIRAGDPLAAQVRNGM